jgi:hypothetical protein
MLQHDERCATATVLDQPLKRSLLDDKDRFARIVIYGQSHQ